MNYVTQIEIELALWYQSINEALERTGRIQSSCFKHFSVLERLQKKIKFLLSLKYTIFLFYPWVYYLEYLS